MPKEDWENDIPEYSLDEILAEFSSRQNPEDESETTLDSEDFHPEEESQRPEEEAEPYDQEKRRPGRRLQRLEKKSGRRLGDEQETGYQAEPDSQPEESEKISEEDAASETQAEEITAQEVRTEEPVTEGKRVEKATSEEFVAEEISLEEAAPEENEPEEIRAAEDTAEEEGTAEEPKGSRFSKFGAGLFNRRGKEEPRSENPEREEYGVSDKDEEEAPDDFEDLNVSEDWAAEEAEEEEPEDADVAETSLFTGMTQRISGFTGRLFNRVRSEEDTWEDEQVPESGEDQELPLDSQTSADLDLSAEEENERPEGEKEEYPEDTAAESLSAEADTEGQEEQPGPFDDEAESTEEAGFSAFTSVSQRVSGFTSRLFNRRPDRNDTEENDQIPETDENEELSWDIETSIDSYTDEEKENDQPAADMEEEQLPADLTGEVLSGTRAETEEQFEASEEENIDFSAEGIRDIPHGSDFGPGEARQENNEREAEWEPIAETKHEDVLSGTGEEETEGKKRYTSFLTRIPFLSKYVKDRFGGIYGEEPPDTSPDELAERYDQGLYSLFVRRWLVLVLAAELLVLAIIQSATGGQAELQLWNIVFPILCAVIQLVALALSYDLVMDGLLHLGINTIITVAALMAFLDSATMCFLGARTDSLPYCLIATLALFARLWGIYMERSTSRSACKTAAAAKEPDCVTLDQDRWEGQPAYTKWPGDITKFGSQIQSEDLTHFIFRRLTAPLLIACLVFSLISALISGRADLIIWNLAATTNACAGLAAALAFALPYWLCGNRLSKACVALAGWKGISRHSSNSYIILGDFDLFPPGSVTLNNMRIFPGYSKDLIVSYTATLINHLGSGLDRIFWEYMRSQGDIYRTAEDVVFHEGGISARIGTDRVLVGDAEFMTEAGVSLPQGLNVKNGVFCAVNNRLAGLFVLDFNLHTTVRPSLSSLLNNGIMPVLATRDFNITPTMLTKRFRLPGSHMVYPGLEDRLDLSDPYQTHDDTPVCILCREGIGPLTEAVVGGRRLFSAVRLNTILAVAEIIIGLLLAFYLTAQVAFASLSMFNLLIFHLAWLIPILLISGWVNRY